MGSAERGFAAAFSLGMGIHKVIGGFAVGAILRRPGRPLFFDLALASMAEGMTLVGVLVCAYRGGV